ncbi:MULTISPECIES: gas vesicle accessory protein GvpU [Salimicrobium]|uniref:Gas vesicle protein GvpU n=1 Tax=Salimicrobium humidisoli TaxID=2029857 RepID=A0ABX4HR23_9BACI|nr:MULTISPECIES: gas vesicle accessory protein GvpU [Salimicrobium]PBB05663.1 gas vesicle protein GvpU [Salimicrobium humidisoli]
MDDILETYVKSANEEDFTVDLTLQVKGALVTGTLTSAYDYLNSTSHLLENGGEASQKISEQFEKAAESTKEQKHDHYSFIHLKDAKVFISDTPTPEEGGVYWRGTLEQVDGYFLGKIEVEE